jgi:hypothetical protein
MEGRPVGERVQLTVQGSESFIITPEISYIHEEAVQRPLKKMYTLDLAFPNIPTKALYKLQISVA